MTTETSPGTTSTNPTAAELARRVLEEAWNGDGEGGTGLLGDLRAYAEEPLIGPTRVSGMGLRPLQLEIAANRRAFPDLRFTVEAAYGDGDVGVALWHAEGTHEGAFGVSSSVNPEDVEPTAQRFRAAGWTRIELRDGRIRTMTHRWSPLSLLQQAAVAAGAVTPEALLRKLEVALPG